MIAWLQQECLLDETTVMILKTMIAVGEKFSYTIAMSKMESGMHKSTAMICMEEMLMAQILMAKS